MKEGGREEEKKERKKGGREGGREDEIEPRSKALSLLPLFRESIKYILFIM